MEARLGTSPHVKNSVNFRSQVEKWSSHFARVGHIHIELDSTSSRSCSFSPLDVTTAQKQLQPIRELGFRAIFKYGDFILFFYN